MFRKYTRIIFLGALTAFFPTAKVSAQTTSDVVMQLQAMLSAISEARGTIEKIASTKNFSSMTGNLGNAGNLMSALKGTGIFKEDPTKGALGKAAPILPADLAAKADNPNASAEWMRNNMRAGTNIETLQNVRGEQQTMSFVAMAQAYGKAVATRKKLDKNLSEISALEEDAQKAEEASETAMLGEINKIRLLTLEQAGYTQMLNAAGTQVRTTLDFFSIDTNTSSAQ